MKNFKLFALLATFSAVACASDVTTAEVAVPAVVVEVAPVVTPVVEVAAPAVVVEVAPVAEVAAPKVEDKAPEAPKADGFMARAYNSVTGAASSVATSVKNAGNTTVSYAKVPFVKANELCNSVNGKMFDVAADDKSYSAMFKSNATQITAGTLVTAAVVYGAYTYLNKPADKKAKN